jgi:hypothetical protein
MKYTLSLSLTQIQGAREQPSLIGRGIANPYKNFHVMISNISKSSKEKKQRYFLSVLGNVEIIEFLL